jgi:hypothetical protein
MMRLKVTEGKFGVPPGTYLVIFVGVKPNEHPKFGAGLEWQFIIADGPYKGRLISRTTSPEPTLKNSCGRILAGLVGGPVANNQEIDIDQFKGRTYQVVVETNDTGNGTRVGTVMPVPNGTPAAPGASAPAAPPAPPPAGDDILARKYWVMLEGKVVELTGAQIHDQLKKNGMPPADLRVMSHDQTSGWKTAADFGLDFPF